MHGSLLFFHDTEFQNTLIRLFLLEKEGNRFDIKRTSKSQYWVPPLHGRRIIGLVLWDGLGVGRLRWAKGWSFELDLILFPSPPLTGICDCVTLGHVHVEKNDPFSFEINFGLKMTESSHRSHVFTEL